LYSPATPYNPTKVRVIDEFKKQHREKEILHCFALVLNSAAATAVAVGSSKQQTAPTPYLCLEHRREGAHHAGPLQKALLRLHLRLDRVERVACVCVCVCVCVR
jgi:hypothetical protein